MITWSPTNLPGVREYRSGGRVYYLTITVFHSLLEVADTAGEKPMIVHYYRGGDTDEELIREIERLITRNEANVRDR